MNFHLAIGLRPSKGAVDFAGRDGYHCKEDIPKEMIDKCENFVQQFRNLTDMNVEASWQRSESGFFELVSLTISAIGSIAAVAQLIHQLLKERREQKDRGTKITVVVTLSDSSDSTLHKKIVELEDGDSVAKIQDILRDFNPEIKRKNIILHKNVSVRKKKGFVKSSVETSPCEKSVDD